eukprot:CAMPEP_0113962026 /NCGR_PEP_ID=MMETSP0011_2-20120614/5667_1 /TAXON_ID=101924 /ORGANISM="Rhodosorus marinus" /LENGTH=839 /DNA_ID=CAMNT_0000973795 /DNA_START=266 /DNA_END=2785 /DNA_ORIENTATION=- /assembly_acc=CAM_ASM_000156
MGAITFSLISAVLLMMTAVGGVEVELDLFCPRSIGGETQWTPDKYNSGHWTVQGSGMSTSRLTYLMKTLGATEGRTGRGVFRRGDPSAIKTLSASRLKPRAALNEKLCTRGYACQSLGGSDEIVMADGGELLDYLEKNNISDRRFGEYAALFLPMLQDKQANVKCPKYFEPVNEGMVYKDPRRYMGNPPNSLRKAAFTEVAKFHKEVCDVVNSKLKNSGCDTLCGGWASGWSDLVRQGFLAYENRLVPFTKEAGRSTKFFSFHTYDSYKQKEGEILMQGGHEEGLMDLVWTHTRNQLGQPKPIVFSEFGAGSNEVWFVSSNGKVKSQKLKTARPYCATRDWAILNSFTGLMSQFSAHPDLILKTVAFALEATYDAKGNPHPWSLERKVNGKTVWTHLIKFFEILAGVKGHYYRVTTKNTKVQVHLLRNGNTFWVLMKNFSKKDQNVKLDFIDGIPTLGSGSELRSLRLKASPGTAKCAREHRLPWSGVPDLSTRKLSTAADVQKLMSNYKMARMEFSVLKLSLRVAPKPRRSSAVKRHFSNREVVKVFQSVGKSNTNTEKFTFNNLPSGSGNVKVRVAVGGYSDILKVKCDATLNGVKLSRPDSSFGPENGAESRWMMFEYHASMAIVKSSSVVTVTCSCNCNKFTGHISSVTMLTEQLSGGGGSIVVPSPEDDDDNVDVPTKPGVGGGSGNGGSGKDDDKDDGDGLTPFSGNFRNGNFENGLSGWTRSSTGKVKLSKDAKKGKRALRITGVASAKQVFRVTSQKRISVSLDMKINTKKDKCEIRIVQGRKVIAKQAQKKTGWGRKTVYFKARGAVDVVLYSGSSKSKCLFDELSIKQK